MKIAVVLGALVMFAIVGARDARAEDVTVVFLSEGPARPGLLDSLAIHVGREARIVPGALESATTLRLRVQSAGSGGVARARGPRRPHWAVAPHAAMRWQTGVSLEHAQGTVEVTEIDLGVGARVFWVHRRLLLGGMVEVLGRLLHAEGRTAGGTRGGADRTLPALLVGPAVDVSLVASLRMTAAVAAEIPLAGQRFALNGEPVLDVGVPRGIAQLGLLVHLP